MIPSLKSDYKNENDKEQATSTVIQSRVPIFAPIKQLSTRNHGEDVKFETQYGIVTFKKSRLTQIHRNILDCIFSYYHSKHTSKDGCVAFLISLRQLQKKLGIKKATHHEWIKEKLEEIRSTPMVIKSKNHDRTWEIHTGIIRKFVYSNVRINNNLLVGKKEQGKGKGKKGEAFYFGIVFENEYIKIFREDMNIHSKKLTDTIIHLRNPLLQAFVRFCISHSFSLNMKIDEVLKIIGAIKCKNSGRHKRRLHEKLYKYKDELIEKFGIKLNNNCVFYEQHPQIWFETPVKPLVLPEKQLESADNTGGGHGLIRGPRVFSRENTRIGNAN